MSLRALLQVASLGLVLAYAASAGGGLGERAWLVSMAAIGLVGLLSWARRPTGPRFPALPRWVAIPSIALPLYLVFQLIPLPLTVLRLLSPARAELVRGLASLGSAPGAAPLSSMSAATWQQLSRLLCYLVVMLIVREAMLRLEDKPWVAVWPLIALGSWEAALGLTQFAPNALDVAAGLAVGTYQSRNHFAGLLEMIAPFAALSAVAAWTRPGGHRHPRAARVVCLISLTGAVLMYTAVVLSLSRMGLVAAFAALAFAGLLAVRPVAGGRWAKPLPILGMFALAVCLMAVAPNRLLERFVELANTGNRDSAGVRVGLWRDIPPMLRDYPIFGCGAGAFQYAFPKYQRVLPLFTIDFAHEDYLQALAELGLVGCAILAAAWIGLLGAAWKAAARGDRSDRQLLGAACLASFLAICLHSLADYNTYIPANGLALSWVAGVALGLPAAPAEHKPIVSVGGYTVIDVTARVIEGNR